MDKTRCLTCGEFIDNTPKAITAHDREDELDGEAYDKLSRQWAKIYGLPEEEINNV